MNEGSMVEIRAVVRTARLSRVLNALEQAGVPRATVNHVHGVGAGVDPARSEVSVGEEGGAYMDKVLIGLICADERRDELIELIAGTARTGKQGDGTVSVHPVLDVVDVRTGSRGPAALE